MNIDRKTRIKSLNSESHQKVEKSNEKNINGQQNTKPYNNYRVSIFLHFYLL